MYEYTVTAQEGCNFRPGKSYIGTNANMHAISHAIAFPSCFQRIIL